MLGFVVVALGSAFVLIGANGLAAGRARRPRPPVPGSGVEDRQSSSPTVRRIVCAAWIVLGVLFVVAAFAHQVP